jgi:hypothetical protein
MMILTLRLLSPFLFTGVFAFSLAMLLLSGTCVITSILLIVALCGVSVPFKLIRERDRFSCPESLMHDQMP